MVKNMMRNVFVVPTEEISSPEIAALEAEAASNPEAKKQLIVLLHVSQAVVVQWCLRL